MSPLSKLLRVAVLLALAFGPRLAAAQKALVYCPVSIDATGCATIKTALTNAYPGGVETGFDGTQGTVDLKTVDLFQYSVVVVPSLADDSTAPYALLRDATVASKLKAALLGRRAFWSGTPDQGVVSTTRPQKDALIQNLAAWASGDFATVNAPGLVVLQDNSTDVTKRYDWVQAIVGFNLIADTRLASYSAVSSLTAAGNSVLTSNGSTLAYTNMASMGFQTPSGAPGTSMDAVGKTGTGVGGQVVLITQTGANTGGAVVTTDKDDYAPGMPVVITGSGFGAGETVTLTLHEDPTIEADFSFTTTADQNGGFVFNGFTPDTLDVDVRFVLTATGQTTGRRAQTTFTDGPLLVQLATTDNAAPANVTWSVTWSVWQTSGGVCTGNPSATNTTTYTGNTVDNGGQNNPPSANQNQSIKIISAQATGTFAAQNAFNYWSSTANSTTPVTPACAAGTQGNTQIGTLFAHFKSASQSVNVSVSTSGTPSAFGSSVTFTATASPLTATGSVQFKDGAANLGSSVNLVNGVATLSTSALSVGQHTITVVYTPGAGFTAGTVTPVTQNVGTASQTITGFNLSTLNKVFGDAPFSITSGVTGGGSGNPVTFASLTTSTCTITAAGQVTIVATGQCTATADQAGDASYSPAPQVTQSFTIGQASATLAIDPASLTATYDGAAHAATVTTTPAGLTVVAITYNGLAAAPTNAGSYPVVAKLTNANYSATDATGTLAIAQATPTFSNVSIPAISYGTSTATISGTVKAGSLPATGLVGITVSGTGGAITGSASVDASGNFTTTVNVAALPANATGYDVALLLPASTNFTQASDNTQKLVINKATQTISFAPLPGKTFGDASFTVSASSTSGLTVTFTASGNCTASGTTITITGAGNCTVNADQAGDGNYQPATQVSQPFAIAKAKATINVSGVTVTYDGSPHGATGTATGVGGADLSASLDLGAKFPNVPGGTANWSFNGNPNYEDASGTAQITINRALGSISITGPATITYKSSSAINTNKVGDGAVSYAASTGGGTICTVDGTTGEVTMLRGTGDCGITATLAQGQNYEGATSTELTIKAAKAVATINVTGFDGVYDTQPHGATGTAVGVGNENLNASLNLGASFTNVPGGTANWTFNGGLDYENASGSVDIKIAKADQSTAVTLTAPSSMTYGQAAVTLTAAGGNGTGGYQFSVGASTGCSLSGADLSVVDASQSCAVTAIRLGDNNYNDSPASAPSSVSLVKANAVVDVKGYTGVYDGQPHGATGTATGAKGEDLSSLLTLGSSFTDVPGGSASWSFAGGNNHNATSGTAAIVITQAPTTTTVTVSGATYDATPHGGTAKVTGAAGLDQGLTITYTGINGTSYSSTTAPTNAGSYTASASYAATTNYKASSDTKPFTIDKRAITLQASAPDLTWTGSVLTPSYSLAVAAASLPLAGTDQLSGFGSPTYSPSTVTNVGSYPITVSGLSSGNYTIGFAPASVVVLDKSAPAAAITSLNPVALNVPPTLGVNFTDVTTGNSNIVEWKLTLDGVDQGTLPLSGGPNVSFSKTLAAYAKTDVVSVCVAGRDAGGNWSPTTCALLAVYDPTAGFVTGGGWIDSPAGAYYADPTLKGKANFGFVSKYQKGATVPSGNTEFQFKEGNLNFSSTSFQWLVIQGTTMSQFKGVGTINGQGSYNFLVTAIDGDQFSGAKKPDSFRIKITNGATVVYDNQLGADDTSAAATILGGGSIQIQSK